MAAVSWRILVSSVILVLLVQESVAGRISSSRIRNIWMHPFWSIRVLQEENQVRDVQTTTTPRSSLQFRFQNRSANIFSYRIY